VGYWASTQSTQTQEFRQESGIRNPIQVSAQPDPSSWFLTQPSTGNLKREHTVQTASALARLRLDRTIHRPILTLECRSRPNELQEPPMNLN